MNGIRTILLALLATLAIATGPATASGGSSFHSRVVSRLDNKVLAKLLRAYSVALRKLERHSQCREMFSELGADGPSTLEASKFAGVATQVDENLCGRSVSAFTSVGSPVISICDNFVRLSLERGALLLIHEALHSAGLRESPGYPDAMTSLEINAMVARSCP